MNKRGTIVRTKRERQPFRFDAAGRPRPVANGGAADGVSCAGSVCYR
ncbi:hypothetical protein [Streptomyces klenkii]